jgi:hypothetical protein
VYTVGGRKFAYFKTSEPERWRFSTRVAPDRFIELTDVPASPRGIEGGSGGSPSSTSPAFRAVSERAGALVVPEGVHTSLSKARQTALRQRD